MMLSNVLQLNLDQASGKAAAADASAEGSATGFLGALLQSQGANLEGADLEQLAAMLAEQAEGELPEGADLMAMLQDFMAQQQDLMAKQQGQAGLNLQMSAAPTASDGELTPEQLLGLMAAGGEAQRGKPPGVELVAAQGRQTALWAQMRHEFRGQNQPESALNTVQGAQHNFSAVLNDARAAEAMPQMRLEHPVQQPGFGQAVGERVTWMANQGIQQARIQLNPAHLGPLEISISVQDEQTSVAITAQHAVTREALQADLPRLREMLGENGFDMVDVNVAQGDGRGREAADETDGNGAGGVARDGEDGAEDGTVTDASSLGVEGRGLVDHYA